MYFENTAIIPVPKLENDFYDWYQRHELKKQAAKNNRFDLIFIGDSITHLFEGHPGMDERGDNVWKQFYACRNALNLGFGWDRTQNVLWRLENGEFENQLPLLAVLNIGTNNLTGTANARENTPEEIMTGVKAICKLIFSKSRQTHILLMGVFPRGQPGECLRKEVQEFNRKLKAFAETCRQVIFLDIGDKFLDSEGNIDVTTMPDMVHPSTKGYQIWAESIEPVLQKYKQENTLKIQEK